MAVIVAAVRRSLTMRSRCLRLGPRAPKHDTTGALAREDLTGPVDDAPALERRKARAPSLAEVERAPRNVSSASLDTDP